MEKNECYILAPERTVEIAERFLNAYLPEGLQAFNIEDSILKLGISGSRTLKDIFHYLETNIESSYTMYWNNTKSLSPLCIIIAFNSDGSLVLGMDVCYEEGVEKAQLMLKKIIKEFKAKDGYICANDPPASSAKIVDAKK